MATKPKEAVDVQPHADIEIWKKVEKTDPNYTKGITGRQYSGTSPNVTYLLRKATAVFGAAGHGFGWDVVEDRFLPVSEYEDGTKQIVHIAKVRFWTRHPETGEKGHVDTFGQTMMVYKTKKGMLLVDEDAPKKSLTDAITKALSWLGFAGDIFLGRYDDNKYVAELRDEFGSDSAPVTPGAPPGQAGGRGNGRANGAGSPNATGPVTTPEDPFG